MPYFSNSLFVFTYSILYISYSNYSLRILRRKKHMKQYATQNTEVKVGPSKFEVFAKKTLAFVRESYRELPATLRGLYRGMYRICSALMRCILRLSIILIALIMLYTFIESHPQEWASCVEFFKDIWGIFARVWYNVTNILRF